MTEPLAVVEKEGTLECTIADLTTGQESNVTLYKGAEWVIRILPCKSQSAVAGEGSLDGFLLEIGCNEQYKTNMWRVDGMVSLQDFSSDGSLHEPIRIHVFNEEFWWNADEAIVRILVRKQSTCDAVLTFDDCVELLHEDFEKISHCQCSLSEITVKGIPIGVRPLVPVNPRSPLAAHDRILVVQDVKFYVQSQVLSMWSGYFDKMFSSDFAEKQSDHIELKDVDADEFEELLGVIYPQQARLNFGSVGSLLELADRFDMPYVLEKCRQFLLDDAGRHFNVFKLMKFAKKFNFICIQELALSLLLDVENLTDYIAEHTGNAGDYDLLDGESLRDVVYALTTREVRKQ